MDPRLLDHYKSELQFVREMGGEFAREYPRIAARLGMDGTECADPYVERLIESFAFLAARVQLKLEARHPEFTRHLTEIVYPHYQCPIPACAVVEFKPDFREDALQSGVPVPRFTAMRSPLAKGERTAVEFRTAMAVTLWPLEVGEVRHISGTGALGALQIRSAPQARAAIRLRLQVNGGASLAALQLDALTFHIKAAQGLAATLMEQLHTSLIGICVRDATAEPGAAESLLAASAVTFNGLDDNEALLPETQQGLSAYRLLQEYFALPEKFQFFTVSGLRHVVSRCKGAQFDIYLLLDRAHPALENTLGQHQFRLYCTPVANLFDKSLDRLHVGPHETEYHLLPDRNRPQDFEVHSVTGATGIAGENDAKIPVRPFYSSRHLCAQGGPDCFYTVQRRPRLLSSRQVATGTRTSYVGTETYVSLTSRRADGTLSEMRQLDVRALCTNRDLPLYLSIGKGRTDMVLDSAAPVETIRCITGPTSPRPSPATGDAAWKLISHLSMNHLTLADPAGGTDSLRELLSIYADPNDTAEARQVEGVRDLQITSMVVRIPGSGPVAFARGLQITITLDDDAFEGTGIVILGAVLDRMFARLVSVNAFTCAELRSSQRGVVKRWPARSGARPIL